VEATHSTTREAITSGEQKKKSGDFGEWCITPLLRGIVGSELSLVKKKTLITRKGGIRKIYPLPELYAYCIKIIEPEIYLRGVVLQGRRGTSLMREIHLQSMVFWAWPTLGVTSSELFRIRDLRPRKCSKGGNRDLQADFQNCRTYLETASFQAGGREPRREVRHSEGSRSGFPSSQTKGVMGGEKKGPHLFLNSSSSQVQGDRGHAPKITVPSSSERGDALC